MTATLRRIQRRCQLEIGERLLLAEQLQKEFAQRHGLGANRIYVETVEYIEQHYSEFENLRDAGLDALIITGANVVNPALEEEAFWEPLVEVGDWARRELNASKTRGPQSSTRMKNTRCT